MKKGSADAELFFICRQSEKSEHSYANGRNNSHQFGISREKQRKTGEDRKFLFYIGALMMYNTEVKAKW